MVPPEHNRVSLSSTERGNPPFVVGWSFTRNCNLQCLHCYSDSGKCLENELNLDQAKTVVDKLSDFGVWAVNFGGGECALRKDFIDLCKYLNEKNIEISYTTNGTTFDLIKNHLDLFHDVGVSIDFSAKEMHDWFRGKSGTFKAAVKTIEYLVNHNVNTEIVTCLNKLNSTSEELSGLYQLAKELNVNYWRLNRYKENGRGDINKNSFALSKEDLRSAHQFLSRLGNLHSPDPLYRASFPAKYFVDGDPSGKTAFRIQPNGDITPCVFISENAGNILDQPIEQIINSSIFKKIQQRTPQGKCNYCSAYEHCQGGDAGASYTAYGHFNGPDPLCYLDVNKELPVPTKTPTEKCNVHELYLCTLYLPLRGEMK